MPHVRKQRDVLYKKVPNENHPGFVHYTSADNALKLIESKRLWMRSTTCMSDYREVQHGFDMLAKFFSPDSLGLAAFRVVLDASAPGVAQEAITLFNQWWNNIRFHTYSASISEHDSNEYLNDDEVHEVMNGVIKNIEMNVDFLGSVDRQIVT